LINMDLLRVMSFNIRHGKGMDEKIDLKRVAMVIQDQDADLVGLQEVSGLMFWSGFINQMKRLGRITGYPYYCYYPNLKTFLGGLGNGVLSKFPIISSYNQVLISSKEPRSAVMAIIDLGYEKIKFINTHLGLVEEERVEQVNEILDTIKKEDKAILIGDFNASPDKLEIKKVIKRGLKDIFVECQEKNLLEPDVTTKMGYTFAYRSKHPDVRIDYIFAGKNIQPLRFKVINSSASDHLPVLAEVKLSSNKHKCSNSGWVRR